MSKLILGKRLTAAVRIAIVVDARTSPPTVKLYQNIAAITITPVKGLFANTT